MSVSALLKSSFIFEVELGSYSIPTGFQIELDELYRFQSKIVYLSPHLHP
jgi:hypothetical protein